MNRLRSIHLYLGCLFGPLLVFFAVSGIWQTLKLHLGPEGSAELALVSTIHTSRVLKGPGLSTLSSPLFEALVLAMAIGLISTAIIGVVMAWRYGRSRRAVVASLAAGVLLPLLLVSFAAFAAENQPPEPERRLLDCIETIPRDATPESLAAKFGAANVVSADIPVAEGMSEPGTLIFPESPRDRVEVLWRESAQLQVPRSVRIIGQASSWTTIQGVTLGTDLKTLERINGVPFSLSGFGWDYAGTVVAWSGGELDPGRTPYCMIWVRLAPELQEGDAAWMALYEQANGDRLFSSSDPVMQQLNPRVYEFGIRY